MMDFIKRISVFKHATVLCFIGSCLLVQTNSQDPSQGPICYECDLMVSPSDCTHEIRCGRDELCMLHEGNHGADGGRRFTAKCESRTVCNAVLPHSLRAVGHVYCHLCCDTDHCNNKCGVTPTTMAPTKLTTITSAPTASPKPPTTPKPSTTPATAVPTTTARTTAAPTTHHPQTQAPTGSLMCYNCDQMTDPRWCSRLAMCPSGYGCMLRQTGTDMSGRKLYKSYCEKNVMCYAYAMYGKKRSVDTEDDVNGDVERLKRATPCSHCCYTNLCNNECEEATTTSAPTTTTTTPAPMTAGPDLTPPKHPLNLNYKGCYTDYSGQRLPYAQITDSQMTIEKCISHCKTNGYMFAGVKSRTQCHCGNDYTHVQITPSSDDQCDTVCAGNSAQDCGSVLHVSVYETNSLCYSCNHAAHPNDCRQVVKCATEEECILYETEDHLLFGGKQYHAGCSLRKVCNTLGSMVTNTQPPSANICHVCCDTPLCNNDCTISLPPATPTTARFTASTHPHTTNDPIMAQQRCERNHFTYIPNVHLCYKVETFQYNRDFAARWCEIESSTLASLFDQGKFSILQMLLKFDPQFANSLIYTGGYDVHANGEFYWPTGERIVPGGWSGLSSSTSGRCLAFDGSNNFNIKAVSCSQANQFICTKEV